MSVEVDVLPIAQDNDETARLADLIGDRFLPSVPSLHHAASDRALSWLVPWAS